MGQSKGVILFQSEFYSGGEGPALEFGSWERPTSRAGPPRSRYCLSHFPPRSTTSNPIGPRRVRKSFCATARFARRIPSSVMDAAANRLMMSTTIGSGFAAVFATAAAKPSLSCRRFLRPTAITASSLAARRYSATSWKAVAGKTPHPQSQTRIAWRIPPPCAAGSAIWILLGPPFSALRRTMLALSAWLGRTELLVHNSLPLRRHTVYPFLDRC